MSHEPFDLASILDEVLGEPLRLTFRGETYTAPTPDTALGVEIEAKFAAVERGVAETLDDSTEAAFYERLWGDEWARITTPGAVPWPVAQLMGQTALIDACFGREVADVYWRNGGKTPKAPAVSAPQDHLPKSGKKQSGASKKKQGSPARTGSPTSGSSPTTPTEEKASAPTG